jgi:hypothetical protein
MMPAHSIFLPLCAQVLLTFAVWLWMYVARIGEIKRHRVPIQELADPAREQAVFRDAANPSDNFENLFELPTLFYVAAIVIFVAGLNDAFYVWAAWAFVGFRALHSLIHCAYNRILPRFYAYFVGSLVLWAIWARIALQIFRGGSMP